jgi:hypothetical protein
LTDHNIAVGGTPIKVVGDFVVTKAPFGEVSVSGHARYSILDKFDWNKDTEFLIGSTRSGLPAEPITDNQLNLLEKCGDAAPFWSAVTWTQSVVGTGTDSVNAPPKVRYTWIDR